MKVEVDGQEPLIGTVSLGGSMNASLLVLTATLLSNEEVVLENVSKVRGVLSDLELFKKLGVSVSWESNTRLKIDASGLSSFEVPLDVTLRPRTVALLVGPLVYRFGRAKIPKPWNSSFSMMPLNRWLDTWETIGLSVREDEKFYYLESKNLQNSDINFKINTVLGTGNALLSSVFIPSQTVINNAANEPEVDALIDFLDSMGASVKRVEPRKIVVNGSTNFHGTKFKLIGDRNEAVFYSIAALLTDGDIVIEGSTSSDLLPFLRKLEQMNANFDFKESTLRVWKQKKQVLSAATLETGPFPSFMTDWQPMMSVLLTQAEGSSFIHETIYTDRLSYVKDLNRAGAKITLFKPSDVGLEVIVSDDSYDLIKLGEPFTVAKIEGPTELRRERYSLTDPRFAACFLLSSLCAQGKSELSGFETLDDIFENCSTKLKTLGAKITVL